jgi:hypothetical protein
MLTVFAIRSGVGSVFAFRLTSAKIRKGEAKRSRTEGIIDKIDCSKSRVKSKLSRHPLIVGPNTLSFKGRHVESAMGGNAPAEDQMLL